MLFSCHFQILLAISEVQLTLPYVLYVLYFVAANNLSVWEESRVLDHPTNQQSHRQLSLAQSIICQSVVRQSSCSFLKVINVLWDWKPNIKRSHLNISQIHLSLSGSFIEIWFWAKGHSLCKQCLHNLQFMKNGSSSPNLSKLTSAVSLWKQDPCAELLTKEMNFTAERLLSLVFTVLMPESPKV